MFSFLGTMNSYGIDQSCILQRIANCAWKHYQNAPSRRKTTVSRIFKKWRRPPLYDQAHSTLYTREKILLAAAAAAAAALPARTPPRRVCSIPSRTAPRAAFHTIFVFLQSAHMSENRPNQASIVFLHEKASKKSSFSNIHFSHASTNFGIFSSRTVRIYSPSAHTTQNFRKIDEKIVENFDSKLQKSNFGGKK